MTATGITDRFTEAALIYSDGGTYVGQFYEGKRQGTLTYSDGTVMSGIWEDDKFIS